MTMATLLTVRNVATTRSLPLLQVCMKRALLREQAIRSMTILSKESGEEYKKLNYTERAKYSGRPVSPHVTIYNFPVAAVSSITNRVCGVTLSLGCAGLGLVELVAGSGSSLALMQYIGSMHWTVAATAKFAVSFPIIYHFLGGVRHLAWDRRPDYLSNPQVEKSSYYLLGASVALSTGLLFF